MNDDTLLRWSYVAILVGMMSISIFYRRKARKSGEVIRRIEEGATNVLLRLTVGAPLFLSILAYAVNPNWMRWSSVNIPTWLRWLGATVGFACVPFVFWVMRVIGDNISETYLTKEHHRLVTTGPYQYVRHPLYAVAIVGFASLAVVAASWFILTMVAAALAGVYFYIIPKEESELTNKFGDTYRDYAQRTGRLFPRPS